jgi:hypothetical protein
VIRTLGGDLRSNVKIVLHKLNGNRKYSLPRLLGRRFEDAKKTRK